MPARRPPAHADTANLRFSKDIDNTMIALDFNGQANTRPEADQIYMGTTNSVLYLKQHFHQLVQVMP